MNVRRKKQNTGKPKEHPYQLTETPEVVEWKPTYFIYVEKKGNFKETAKAAWGQFFDHIDKIDAQVKREKHISQYRMDEEPWIYRAGYTVSSKPTSLPDGFHCIELQGGSYFRFILTGSYEHLGEACERVWNIIGSQYQHQQRKDWNIEYYVNDMKQVKPEELKTEILIPIKPGNVENVKSLSTFTLSEKPEYFEWKPCYFVYCEREGHFLHTAKPCWEQFLANVDKIDAQVKREKQMCIYRFDIDPWIYRAGYTVNAKPTTLPEGYHFMEFPGGQYLRWIMNGSDVHMPDACGKIFQQMETQYSLEKRADYNIEHKNEHPDGTYHMEICIPVKQFCEGGTAGSTEYQLTEKPDNVEWKPYHYVYVEKKGPFQDTAKACWDQMKANLSEIMAQTTVDKFIAQYRTDTEPWVYRAGVTVPSPPKSLPSEYNVEEFTGGSFLSFTVTGGYNHLPEACGRVFNIMSQKHASEMRKDWNIEYYVNDPGHTKPQDLITQIMVPVNKSDAAEMSYQLTEKPDTVEWKQSHFIYCEQKGDFSETAQGSWAQFFGQIGKIDALVKRDKLVSQFRIDTNPHIFRAGATIPSAPTDALPDGYALTEVSGGAYLRFLFTGEFSELPEARDRIFELVKKNHANEVKSDGWMLQYHTFGTKNTEILVPKK